MKETRRTPRGVLARAALFGAGLLWAVAARAQELQPTEEPLFGLVLERQELCAAVLDRNPGIAAARQAWEAARERIAQAESLEDPMASYELAPLSLRGDAPFGHQLRLGQRLPFPGTLRLRGEVAAAEAAAAAQRVEEVRLRLWTMASLLFDDYYLVARALEINAAHLRLLEDLQELAVSRYGLGLGPQQAPIQAEVEAAHLMHRQIVLETDRRTLTAQLNALLHREPRAPLPEPPGELAAPLGLESAGAEADVAAARPEIRAQREEIGARRAAVELRKLGSYPDFEVMASYNSMWDMEAHRWMVGAGVNLPIGRKRIRAGVAEAEAWLGSAESELARLEAEVRAEVAVARHELQKALHLIHLYRNRLLPAARDQIAAARAGFETGATPMVSLIDAERSLRTAELDYHQALADASSRHAELERALGRLPSAAAATEPTSPAAAVELETP